MEPKRKRTLLILLTLSLGLALLGQYYFAHKRPFLWDGILLYALAMLLFGVAASRIEGAPQRPAGMPTFHFWQQLVGMVQDAPLRFGVLGFCLALSLYTGTAAGARPTNRPFWDLLYLWLASVLGVAVAFVDWGGLPKHLAQAWAAARRNGPEVALVVLLTVATFLFRAVDMTNIPYVLSGDEASMGLEAVGTLEGRLNNPFATGWLSHPTLFFFIQGFCLRLFGITTAALRLPSAFASAAIAVLLYLFARRFFGRWVAILATIYYAAYHYAIHYGRLAINNIWDPFFALGVYYFLERGLTERRRGYLVIVGLFAGFSIYFYMGARLIAFILGVYLLHWLLSQRDFLRENLVNWVFVGLVTLVVALPLLIFFRAHPQDMMARWNWLGIYPSGWVKQQMQAGRTETAILVEQFLKAVLAFNYYPDPTFWYHPGIPLLQFLPSILFVFGLAYAVKHSRRREHFLLWVWCLMVAIFGGMLLENPPTSPRFVLSIPPVVICLALGVVKVVAYLQALFDQPRRLATVATLVFVLALSYQSAQFYFGKYTPSHEFAGHNTEVADTMGKYLRVLGAQYRCYFFGPPRMYYGFATIPYFARGTIGSDVAQSLRPGSTFSVPERPVVFVFLPERRGELEIVQRSHPNGLLREFRNSKGQLLFVSYEVES